MDILLKDRKPVSARAKTSIHTVQLRLLLAKCDPGVVLHSLAIWPELRRQSVRASEDPWGAPRGASSPLL
jgi:hypothetical protein